MMRVGTPDGYGRFAVLDTDDGGRLMCHECGKCYDQLATHVRLAHGVTADEYRRAHGLGRTTRLVSASSSETMAAKWQEHAETHLAVLELSRDPGKAAASSLSHTKDGPWAPEVRAKRRDVAARRKGRALTEAESSLLVGEIDLQIWADHARRILADPTVSTRSVAEACGIAVSTVAQRLRRYPPKVDISAL